MKVLALTEDGRMTYCTASEDQMGKGRCNHVRHQKEGQSVKDFIEEIIKPNINKDLEAMKQNGLALGYIKNQTPELCMVAVKENGLALEYVKKQTPEIIAAAIEEDPDAIEFVKI